MAKRRDDTWHARDEDLAKLEDEMTRGHIRATQAAERIPVAQQDLPSPLYRLKIMHSSETFYAWLDEDRYPGLVHPQPASPPTQGEPDDAPVVEPTRESTAVSVFPSGGSDRDAREGVQDSVPGTLTAILFPDTQPSATTGAIASAHVAATSQESDLAKDSTATESVQGTGGSGKAGIAEARGKSGSASAAETETLRQLYETGFLPTGGLVVACTRYGHDLCQVQGEVHNTDTVQPDEVVEIDRVATVEDLKRQEVNEQKEQIAFEYCRQRIESRALAMKLVSTHYLLDEAKILFYFSAEARVDFRELVKDLVAHFKMRIELRQIGVRDEARVTGGMGVCGRVLCCHGVSDKLVPVSIKMAKDQNLSLNSTKISGPCSRLLCCLAYEYTFYRDARRELPGEGVKFFFEDVGFKVIEVNALAATVKVAGEDGRILDMPATRFIFSEGRWHVRPSS